jgi:glutaredoxin 3
MTEIVMYCTRYCPYCERARLLLRRKGVSYTEVSLDEQPHRREEMERRADGRTSVPQIFIGEHHIGGYDNMAALDLKGELDPLLEAVRASSTP